MTTSSASGGAATLPGPLSGLRVLELTIYVQGPVGGEVLGMLGAEVIKIEPPQGEPSRRFYSSQGITNAQGLTFRLYNANKQSLVLDLHLEADRARLHELVRTADAFITNLTEEALTSFAADRETLLALNPDLVYGRAGGFGDLGPMAGWPCQDTVGMAFAGMMFTCSPWEDEPSYPQINMSDVLSGTMLAFAVVTGLLSKQRFGKGVSVRTSQAQTLLWTQLTSVGNAATIGQVPMKHSRRQPRSPIFSMYETGDGKWLAMGLIREDQWETLAPLLGLVELLADERFEGPENRAANSEALASMIQAAMKTKPLAEWVEILHGAGLWISPVNKVIDLVNDPQVLANNFIVELEDGVKMAEIPFTLDGYAPPRRAAPPLALPS